MCGRFSIDSWLAEMVRDEMECEYSPQENMDLRPTNEVTVLIHQQACYQPLLTHWGIQPGWATHMIINAQSETAAKKKTFRDAMANHRCLVPCSGWYEWRDEGNPRKQKYLFAHEEQRPLYMAGIWFPADEPKLVLLTVEADDQCLPYHHRMPLLIGRTQANEWLSGLVPRASVPLAITPC